MDCLHFSDNSCFIGSPCSHDFCYICFIFCLRYMYLFVVCGGLGFLFSVAPSSLAVFAGASAFNSDVSKWNTGAVTTMYASKCTLSPSLWPRLPLLCILNIRQLECHRITLLTRFVILNFCVFETVLFFVVCGGLVFSLLHPFCCCVL